MINFYLTHANVYLSPKEATFNSPGCQRRVNTMNGLCFVRIFTSHAKILTKLKH
jgi:hypothetical protein